MKLFAKICFYDLFTRILYYLRSYNNDSHTVIVANAAATEKSILINANVDAAVVARDDNMIDIAIDDISFSFIVTFIIFWYFYY